MAQDLFGRDAGNVDSKSMMQSLSGKVSKILETKSSNAETALAKVVDAVNELSAKFDSSAQQESAEAAKFANSVIQCYKDIFKRSGKDGDKKHKVESVEAKLGRKAMQQIVKMGASPNTFWVGIGHFHQKAINQLKRVLVDCGLCGTSGKIHEDLARAEKRDKSREATRNVASAGMNNGSRDGGAGAPMGGGPGGGNFNYVLGGLRSAGLILSGMLSKMGDMFETKLTDSFKGVLIHSNKLRENLRTVIFQTQGYSETNRAMEKDFMDLRQATISSGVASAKYDEQWIKNLQLGFSYMSKAEKGDKNREQILQKQIRTHKSVQTSALNTAATLGMSVDGTNDMFMSWHMQLGMSANELANMGRSMKQISLSTGVTGLNLEKAMKSTDSIMRNMRDTGSLTDTAAENVMNMSTIAQKLGAEDTMNPLLKAMSGGTNMFDADGGTKKMLNAMMFGAGAEASEGMYWAVRSGDILEDKQKMAQGQENMAARARDALRGAGVQNADSIDLNNLTEAMKSMSQQQKSIVQSNFKNMLGALPGQFERIYQTFEEGKKTDGQKLQEITNEINSAKARGAGNTDSTKALERKRNELESGNIQQVFGKISDQMKQGKTLEEAKANVYKETEGKFGAEYASKLIGDMGGSANKLMSTLQERAKASGKNLNDVLTAKGMSEQNVLAALKSGTAEQRMTATEIIDSAMQEIGQAESANRDPVTKIAEGVRLINDKLQRLVDRILFSSDLLVQVVFWVTKAAVLAGAALGLLAYLPTILSFLGGGGMAALGRVAMSSLPMIGGMMTKALGPLALAIGAFKGAIEAQAEGRTELEGAILGALTGGAGTGSMISGTLGLEKGGVADKSLGVAGAAVWGMAVGALLGPVGAAIGGIVGAAVEIVKILTQGTTILSDIISPIQELISGVWKAVKGIFGLLWNIITLDFGGVIQSLYDIVDGLIGGVIRIVYSFIAKTIPGIVMLIYETLKAAFFTFPIWLASNILSALKSVLIDFPIWLGSTILSGIKSVLIDLPMWIGGMIIDGFKSLLNIGSWIKEGLASLANNEWVGPIFSVLGDSFNALYEGWMSIYSPLKQAFDNVSQSISGIIEPITSLFSGIFGGSSEWTLLGTVMDGLKIAVNGLAQAIAFVLKPIVWLANILGFLLKIVGGVIQAITDFASGIMQVVKGFLTFDGTAIMEGLTKAFVDLPMWLFDSITSGLMGLGSWIYDNVIGSILDLIPDWIKTPAKAIGSAVSAVGGAISDPIGTIKNLGSKALDIGGAALEYLNPFSYFAEGTKSVKQPGLAVLHEGEMVVPKNEVKAIAAIGNGPFGSASSLNSGAFENGQGSEANDAAWQQRYSEIKNGTMLTSNSTETEKLIEALYSTIGGLSGSASGGVGLGLFDPINIFDAMQDGVSMLASGVSNTLTDPIGAIKNVAESLFSPGEMIYNKLTSAFSDKSKSEKESSIADTGKSMYYSDVVENMTQGVGNVIDSLMNTPVGKTISEVLGLKTQASTNLLDYSDDTKGQTSTNLLDYSDNIKGSVAPTMFNISDTESRVAQEKYGSIPSGSIEGMSGIEDYLAQEQNMMKIMIEYLAKIEINTSPTKNGNFSKSIGPKTNGLPQPEGMKMRRISQEQSSGEWDLLFNDYSPNVTT